MENNKKRIDDIEILRAFAILLTIAQHFPFVLPAGSPLFESAHKYFTFWSGVDLFFAISGFVIGRNILERLECSDSPSMFWRNTVAFWIKRAYRIWPTSWLWLIVILTSSAVLQKFAVFSSVQSNLASFAASVMQVQNIHLWECVQIKPADCGDAGIWWSLSLEEQFYLLLPLAAFIFRRRLLYFLIAVAAFQILSPRLPISMAPASLAWMLRTDAICLGVLLSVASRTSLYRMMQPRFMENRFKAFALTSLLFVLLTTVPLDQGKIDIAPFSTGLVAIVSAVLVFIASFNGDYIVRNRYLKAPLLWVGTRSFALYIIHWPASILARAALIALEPPHTHFGANFNLRYVAIWAAITFVGAELNYRLIENPLRMRGRIVAKRFENTERESAASPLTQEIRESAIAD
jgi:peptidoglycan/LPS O-acetylase OafA/YrhL